MSTIAEQRAAVVEAAYSWLLTPYHHMGMIKGVGVDCATLLACVYAEAGMIEPFSPDYYPPDWMMHRNDERYIETILSNRGHEVTRTPKPGDVVAWKFGRCFSHAAIVIDWPTILHAHMGARAVVLGDATKEGLAGREMKTFSLWDDD